MASLRVPRWLALPTRTASALVLPAASARCASRGSVRLASSLPSVTQTSFWRSLIPKPLRSDGSAKTTKPKSKEWNPATFYIVIFLLIGSMSIQMISLRKGFENFNRKTDVRIGLLREVIERVQKGEEVDVEQALGTGDLEREQEWEQLLIDIEKDNKRRQQKGLSSSKVATTETTTKQVTPEPQSETEPAGPKPKTASITSNFF